MFDSVIVRARDLTFTHPKGEDTSYGP